MFRRIDYTDKRNDFTGLVGYLPEGTTYKKLVETFGEPHIFGPFEGDGKLQAEWCILFEGEVLARIYDWKKYDQPVETITKWNIGGHSGFAIELVKRELQKVSA